MVTVTQNAKILIVASPWLGGSGSVAFRIAEELAKKNYEVHFLSYEAPFKSAQSNLPIILHKVVEFNYSLFPFPIRELALAEDIVEIVLTHDIHIIHAHYGILFGHAAAIAQSILAARNHRVKLIVTFHGTDVLGFDMQHPGRVVPRHLNIWTIQSADEVTVVTKCLRDQLQSLYAVKREIRIIPNFVDIDIFKRRKRNSEEPRLIHISNFREVKQPLVVAQIFDRVLATHPNARLILIGDGPEKEKVLKYVEQNHISSVSFEGPIEEERRIAEHLQNAHVLLLPSLFESFSLSALEAQACGVPVVASNVGGIPELIIDGKTGYLCDPGNVAHFARNANLILDDKERWTQLSRCAEANGQQYASSKVIEQYVDLYER